MDFPLHEESLGYRFAISTAEVTVAWYERLLPQRDATVVRDGAAAVTLVTLTDAMFYCRRISEAEGVPEDQMCYRLEADGKAVSLYPDFLTRTGYRLPTEFEWEYACRAGTRTRRFFGHSDELVDSYGHHLTNARGLPLAVGLLKPNAFGLFDVYGNVQEWCHGADARNPSPEERPYYCQPTRGGSCKTAPLGLRSATRITCQIDASVNFIGFRVARTLSPSQNPQSGGVP